MNKNKIEAVKLTVRQDKVGPVLARHPWVFSGAIKDMKENMQSGAPVSLYDEHNIFLALGYFNSYSQIAVRVWGYKEGEKVDENFFCRRIKQAWDIRQNILAKKKTNAFRLVNSENDFLPGLIVDKYADYLVVQFHTAGMKKYQDLIIKSLVEVIKPKGIYERSEKLENEREKEGLMKNADEREYGQDKDANLLYGKVPELITIKENGFLFYVDVKYGQKTGFFLDQRDKRQALIKYCDKKSVLNCFCYTGGFTVYALAGGAKETVSVDVSQKALSLAQENIKLNKFDQKKCKFICEDVKKYLYNAKENVFDVIILDPPAFIKDRRKKEQGLVGYKAINEKAIKIIKNNSILLSCSCSNALSLEDLRHIITQAGAKNKKTLQMLEILTFGQDHPVLSAFNQTEYLKAIFARVSAGY